MKYQICSAKYRVPLTILMAGLISWLAVQQYPLTKQAPPAKDAAANRSDLPGHITAPATSVNSQTAAAAPVEPDKATQVRFNEAYGKLPLSFEANQGQVEDRVKYLSRGDGFNLFLTPTETVLVLRTGSGGTGLHPDSGIRNTKLAVLRMKLVGANPRPKVKGIEEQPGRSNYFIGNDPAKWRTNVAHFARVQYSHVYPGVDLVYYGNQRQLEYDFVVAPGTDPGAIRLAFDGARDASLDRGGDLVLRLPEGGEVRQRKPVIYQEVGGQREEVAGHYVLKGEREVGFEIGEYDASRPLVIDPVLSYSSYLGGSRVEEGWGIAVDSFGNAYVTGRTQSTDFPTVNSRPPGNDSNDVFVTKINPSGSAMVYSTYLGGRQTDQGFGVAVDSTGHAYVTGFTHSPDFPVESPPSGFGSGRGQDAFVTKLSPEGSSLVYSTYLGGSAAETGYSIALDSAGGAYVTGHTNSPDFPVGNAAQPAFGGDGFWGDAFVAKLNAAGTAFAYSTYLGGGGYDEGRSIAVDSAGSAYVTGFTHSANFPTANAFQPNISSICPDGSRTAECLEAFVTKLSPAGTAFVYSTYLGGGIRDEGHGIALDSAGNAYVAGTTSSKNFPVTADAFQPALSEANNGPFIPDSDAFVTKFNASGTALLYSTYLGGSRSSEQVGGIAINADGSAYVAGSTGSATFPVVDSLQPRPADGGAAFVTKLNPTGTGLAYSTYLGGDNYEAPNAIALDSAGNAYLTGWTLGGFPVLNAFQPTIGGGTSQPDAFVAKIGNAPIQQPIVLALNTFTPGRGGNSGSVTVSLYGTGFKSGATVKLTRAGQPDINAASVSVSEDFFIARARFDLVGHAPGLRDVVLTNPDGRSATRAASFNVVAGGQPDVWVDLIGRNEFRPGRPQTYYIAYGNRGSVDAALVPIYIAMPKGTQYELGFNLVTPPQPVPGETFDFSQIPPHYETDEERVLPLFIGFLPAGRSSFLKIRITGGEQPIRLIARRPQRFMRAPLILGVGRGSARVKSQDAQALSDFDPDLRECFTTFVSDMLLGCAVGVIPGGGCAREAGELMFGHMVTAAATAADIDNGTFDGQDAVMTATQFAAGQVAFIGKCAAKELSGPVGDIVNCGFAANNILDDCFDFDVIEIVRDLIPFLSRDPNDKFGPVGVGRARYLSGEEPLRYSVNFENLESANAPAQDVVVTDQLDGSKLDFDTFSLGPISFGKDRQVIPPPGLSEFKKDIDLRPSNNLVVRVEAKLEKATGLLTWRFTSLDPATGQPTEDPTAGFLPPNKNAPEGEGQVLFTVRPKEGVATGTEIRNKARIVFDANAPIDTPEWLNTIDYSKPVSQVLALAALQNSSRFEVKWSGTDTGSDVQSYTIFVSEDGGAFSEWLRDTAAHSAFFTGRPGRNYAFYSVARDAVGNYEDAPTTADAATAIQPLVLQLSASSYSVDEGHGHAVITVTRSGNTDEATVGYATGNDTASDRSDYTTALGTLHFAAGQGSKSFNVLITDDALVEGSETITVTLTNTTGGATLGVQGTATLTIVDNDTAPSAVNPLSDALFFARQHYYDFLNRAPDAGGLNFWASQISACDQWSSAEAKGACLEERRINVSAAFFLSTEFQQTGYLVFRFYRASFPDGPARPRGLPRLDEFLRDSQEIGRDVVVGESSWQAVLENNRREFARKWVERADFLAQFPETLPAQQFVDGLFANSGVVPTEAERGAALAAYGDGGKEGRARGLRSVAESGSVYNTQYNPAFVLMQYFGYLRRNPFDPPEPGLNYAGYDFWLNKLDEFSLPGEDVRDEGVATRRAKRAEMVRAFLVSGEYMKRFGPDNFDIRR
jgi:hypothetical protein